jgi:hypothetical protein
MGYRSAVAIAIEGSDEMISALTAKIKLAPFKFQEFAPDCFTFETYRILFEVNDMKWYSQYPEVEEVNKWYESIEAMYESADDEDETNTEFKQLCGKFVRIGEETDDIEEKYFGDDYIDAPYCSRSIGW